MALPKILEKFKQYLPLSGGSMTGFINFNGDVGATWPMPNGITYSVRPYSPAGAFQLVKEKQGVTVAAITFSEDGNFSITACDFSTEFNLYGTTSGSLFWGDKHVVRSVNGMLADASGNINLIPVGSVMAFAANSSPSGYLLCNGAAVSRTTYAALFAKIGTTYGSGDGSTTFNLPNLTDRFIQGSGTAGTAKSAGAPNISGSLAYVTGADGVEIFFDQVGAMHTFVDDTSVQRPLVVATGSSVHVGRHIGIDASRSNSIYGASNTVQPPALTMRYYIKY